MCSGIGYLFMLPDLILASWRPALGVWCQSCQTENIFLMCQIQSDGASGIEPGSLLAPDRPEDEDAPGIEPGLSSIQLPAKQEGMWDDVQPVRAPRRHPSIYVDDGEILECLVQIEEEEKRYGNVRLMGRRESNPGLSLLHPEDEAWRVEECAPCTTPDWDVEFVANIFIDSISEKHWGDEIELSIWSTLAAAKNAARGGVMVNVYD
ncbi:hypothetical protein B0H11DRAFT_1928056 [Mycena galericulata]|nr:hypothetical protein B0H11DRAFT_1928056 [Mycena galericulata]